MKKVCIIPSEMRIGGPAVFRKRIEKVLGQRAIGVTDNLSDQSSDAVLIINGTRHLFQLIRTKLNGVRIVQRLGLPNDPRYHLQFGKRWYLYSCITNVLMDFIRKRIADHIVYQSRFVENAWNEKYGLVSVPSSIIYNGVDLKQFAPDGERYQSPAKICILSVEGTQAPLSGESRTPLARGLIEKGIETEVLVFGSPWGKTDLRLKEVPYVKLCGHIPNSKLPFYYRGATAYILTDLISACPNSVLEALACGTPVLGYRVGVLSELIGEKAGLCIDYGDRRENVDSMIKAVLKLSEERETFSISARSLAERKYDLEQMVDLYMEVLRG
jgi:glycosyltransferase involved in cell wall biosynthesis